MAIEKSSRYSQQEVDEQCVVAVDKSMRNDKYTQNVLDV